MSPTVADEYSASHYPNAWERAADHWIHVVAIALAAAGTGWLVWLAQTSGRPGLIVAATLYGAALIAMLAFSALYNLSHPSPARPILRRLDEAGIFLMIAGSYTPFTTQRLEGAWAVGMTSLVWALAALGIVGKLVLRNLPERVWTGLYILFGWLGVMALEPLSHSVPVTAIALLIAGGLVYSGGSLLFLNARLPFRRAVWHGCVCVGAGLHYLAIVAGVVLVPLRG